MPDTRTLPIAAEHREWTVKLGGEAMPREHHLLSASISLVANRIGSARLAYLDGDAASSDFPLSNTGLLTPGQSVEILAGAGTDIVSLFQGVVVRHALRVRDHSAPQLIVECRHQAMKLAAVRRNASFFEQSDSEVIEHLLAAARIGAQVESLPHKHQQLVQFHTSDWDFLLARAAANGLLAWPRGDQLVVRRAAVAANASVTLQFGATLLELDAEIDARQQYKAVRGVSWDPAQQAVLEVDAAAPAMSGPGNLSPDALAGVAAAERLELRHAALDEAEAHAWADAAWQQARLNKVSGRAKCEGLGTVAPGDTIALAGVGKRFNGNVFVTGVRHDFDLVQGWKTHVQFGGIAPQAPAQDDMSAPAAGNLLARVAGLQVGVVVSNEDPDGEHRVRIRLPLVSKDDDGIWARVARLDAGSERGFFFAPEIGDEVVAGFLDEDPRRAVILGMLHSSAKPAPLPGSDDNNEKMYRSRAGMRLYFNDDTKVLQIDTPSGNRVVLSEADKSIVLADQNHNSITLDADGIRIDSAKALTIKAGSGLTMEAGTSCSVKGGTGLKLEGGTEAELASGATTKVTGTQVQIN